jgi:hypothetical protein
MARLMLLLGAGTQLRRRTLASLSARPELFAEMLRVHVGEARMREFGVSRALSLGWAMLRA